MYATGSSNDSEKDTLPPIDEETEKEETTETEEESIVEVVETVNTDSTEILSDIYSSLEEHHRRSETLLYNHQTLLEDNLNFISDFGIMLLCFGAGMIILYIFLKESMKF